MHAIHDPTNFWLSWDPTDSEDIRLLQKYVENNGSTAYLPSSTVRNLISLWNYMNLSSNRKGLQNRNIIGYIISWMNNGPNSQHMGLIHPYYASFTRKGILVMPYISLMTRKNSKESLTTIFCTETIYLYISFNRKLWMS